MGQYDDLQAIYGGQLGEPELQHKAIREAIRMEEVLSDHEERLTEAEVDRMSAMMKMETKARADATSLQVQMLRNAGNMDVAMVRGWVSQQNNIRDNFRKYQTELNATALDGVEKAAAAARMNVSFNTDANQAGWEAYLGTRLTPGVVLYESDPSAHMALQFAEQQFGKFDPANFNQVTVAAYNKFQVAAQQKKNNIESYAANLEQQATDLQAAQAAVTAGRKGEAANIINEAAQRKPVEIKSFDSSELQERVRAAMDKDPEVQKLRQRTDHLWETVLDKGSSHRTSFANLLSKEHFQEWAKENDFVVGKADVVRDQNTGKVVSVNSFVPGKDLMHAYDVYKKQLSRRPEAGMKGPLIARKGERDLVRLVKSDGEVVLGKTLPSQAADETGSYRISTAGGEVYVRKEDIKNVDVVKPKPEFGLGKAVREARGAFDELRADRAYRDLVRKGGMPDPVDGDPLPEAVDVDADADAEPQETEPVKKPEAKKTTKERRKESMLTEKELMDAIGEQSAQGSVVPTATDVRAGGVGRSERDNIGGIPPGGEGSAVKPGSPEAGALFKSRRKALRKKRRMERKNG